MICYSRNSSAVIKFTLKELVAVRNEKINPQRVPNLQYIGMADVTSFSGIITNVVRASEMKATSARFHPGDVLYGRLRPYLNKVAHPDFDGVASTEFIVMKPTFGLDSGYLAWRLRSKEFVDFAVLLNSGDRPRVKFEQISDFEIYLPPIPEQKRIVAKIESLFSRLDSSKDSLERVRQEIKRYRQSVLKSAFEGKLTNEWRNKGNYSFTALRDLINKLNNKRSSKIRKTNGKSMFIGYKEGRLPESWVLEKLDCLTHKITDGTHKTPIYGDMGVPFISVKDISEGKISFEKCKYISPEEHKALYKRCNPENGDVLITKSGTIGRVAVVTQDFEFSMFVSVALIKPIREILNAKYLAYALMDYINKIDISKTIKGGLVKNFHLEDIRESVLPICLIEEQKQIVNVIESRFERAKLLEDTVEQGLEKIEQLKQSVLKKAFEGKLVEPNPNDESVEALLERIRKQRAILPTIGSSKRKKR